MKKQRWLLLLTAVLILMSPWSVLADSGPKPKVQVAFKNLKEGSCYATLLSETPSTGPAWAADQGKFDEERYGIYGNGIDKEGWMTLVNYQDSNGYYFLQEVWKIDGGMELNWNYYPPQNFKICVYYPETGRILTSEPQTRYAFISRFTADLSADDGIKTGEGLITVKKDLAIVRESGYLLLRIVMTIVVELLIGLAFGFRKKPQIRIIILVNIITQILLNTALFFAYFRTGPRAYIGYGILLEILIIVIEALIYRKWLHQTEPKRSRTGIYWLYAFVANVLSFVAGLFLPM